MIDYFVVSLTDLLQEVEDDNVISNELKKFSCSLECDLEDFLHNKAITYEKSDVGRTYLIIDNEKLELGQGIHIIAFFTIGLKSINIEDLPKKKKKAILGKIQLGDKKNIPTHLIGQLGRDDQYSNSHIMGDVIIKECLHQINRAKRIIGGRIVMIECKKPLIKFYERNHFTLVRSNEEQGFYHLYMRIQ